MNDLHARLVAAVDARREAARAAGGERWLWRPVQINRDGVTNAEIIAPMPGQMAARIDAGTDEVRRHIAANDPDAVIRHCERDLRVLERHAPVHIGGPAACKHAWVDSDGWIGWIEDYPCDEIRDLATAYAVEADDA